jgi:hypothetical protein
VNVVDEAKFFGSFATSRILDYFNERTRIPQIALSIMLFGIPVYTFVWVVFLLTGISEVVTYGFLLALSWLTLAPYFIWKLEYEARIFLNKLSVVVLEKEYPEFIGKIDRLVHSPIAYICGTPFIFGVSILIFVAYSNLPTMLQIGLVIILGILFLLAGIGFWGVLSLIRVTRRLTQLRVRINPFHPDRFGGLGFVGSITIQVTLGFSTGSLVIPLALEVMIRLQSYAPILLAQVLAGVYILMIVASFLVPTFTIHSWIAKLHEDFLAPLSNRMNETAAKYISNRKAKTEKELRNLDSVYAISTKWIKKWPFDLQVIMELIASILLPIIVLLVQVIMGR